jgi:hypothetical protein
MFPFLFAYILNILKQLPYELCKLIGDYCELDTTNYHGVLLCVDQKIVVFDAQHNFNELGELPNSWHVMIAENRVFQIAHNMIEEWSDLRWTGFAKIDTTNYSRITMFRNQFVNTGSIRDNQCAVFAIDVGSRVKRTLPDMIFARCGHQTQCFQDRLYVLGGVFGKTRRYGCVDEVESFDGKTWHKHQSMPFPNFCFATAVTSTHLFVLGGMLCDGDFARCPNSPTSRVWKYDPINDQWTECARMLEQRSHFVACFCNDFIYVFSHAPHWVERYDPRTNVWSRCTPMLGRLGSSCSLV